MKKLKSIFEKIKCDLQNLFTLTMMQSKQKIDYTAEMTLKQRILGSSTAVFKFVIIVVAIYFIFYIFTILKIFSLTFTLPIELLVTIFIFMQLLSAIGCTRGLLDKLYFSGDNQILLTLPVKSNLVFLSKMLIFYINELKKNINFLLPVFIAFGLINGYSLSYYPALALMFIYISFIPVLIGVILSVPGLFLTLLVRRNPVAQSILLVTVIVTIAGVLTYLINGIPENLDLIGNYAQYFWGLQDFLVNITNTFPIFDALVRVLTDVGLQASDSNFVVDFTIVASIILSITVIIYFAVKPLFFRMISKPFEFKGKVSKMKDDNNESSQFYSSIKKQFILKLRDPGQLTQSFAVILGMPLTMLLLNTLYAAMNTRMLGNQMAITFNVLIILLISLTTNERIASTLSVDGDAIYQLKTKPVNSYSTVVSKFAVNLSVLLISLTLTGIVLITMAELPASEAWSVIIMALLVNLAHVLWSVEMDILNPQYRFYKGGQHQSSNPNQNKSFGLALLLSFLIAGWTFFLLLENPDVAWIKLILLCIGIFALRLFFFITRVKAYFSEI